MVPAHAEHVLSRQVHVLHPQEVPVFIELLRSFGGSRLGYSCFPRSEREGYFSARVVVAQVVWDLPRKVEDALFDKCEGDSLVLHSVLRLCSAKEKLMQSRGLPEEVVPGAGIQRLHTILKPRFLLVSKPFDARRKGDGISGGNRR